MLALVRGLLLEYCHIHSQLQRDEQPPTWDVLTNSLVEAQNTTKGKAPSVISPPEQSVVESPATKVAMAVEKKPTIMCH